MRLFCILTTLLFSYQLSAFETYYHSTKAKDGDGIFSLLRRYQLNDHPCNKKQFLDLNKLSIKDQLHVGKEYKLPILIYKYNGTSIRTTIGIDSWEQAVRIKEYNEDILKNNLRKTQYSDSKILWVPYHEIHCNEDLPPAEAIPASKEVVTHGRCYVQMCSYYVRR